MPAIDEVTRLELGRMLVQVREAAGLRQAELARRITWSPASLSRAESGDRAIAPDELPMILEAIGTPEARDLAEALGRDWVVLPRPDLDHPDQDLLWEAEILARDLRVLSEAPGIPQPFVRRLGEYETELRRVSGLLMRRDHNVAFVGNIGVGKSTAICRVTGLETEEKSGRRLPVLDTGGGGVTLCEVHLRPGPGYGVVVEPRSDAEIRADVADFVDFLLRGTDASLAVQPESDSMRVVPREIERAIRNMAQLGRQTRPKDAAGKVRRADLAKELAVSFPSHRELAIEILDRMSLHRRDRRDIWYDQEGIKESPLEWLKATFAAINNGRHAEFTLPARIDVIIPTPLLPIRGCAVSIIDTRGIDQPTARADLETLLEDRHTISILCSGFNEAPAPSILGLLQTAREIGNDLVQTNAGLLVLARPDEALAVKDEGGALVESASAGYELKSEQVEVALGPLRLSHLACHFFNALGGDDPSETANFLVCRIEAVRSGFRTWLREVIDSGRALVENNADAQTQAVLHDAAGLLRDALNQHTEPARIAGHVHDGLLSAMMTAHASTVRASVRREGEWINLSYSHLLGNGARRMAALAVSDHVRDFVVYCQQLALSGHYREAAELLLQAGRLMSQAHEELLRRVQLMGQELFRDDLRQDPLLWLSSDAEWGQGPGYRNRVVGLNAQWFQAADREQLEIHLCQVIAREWAGSLARVSAIFAAG